jgi:hypothetical protein
MAIKIISNSSKVDESAVHQQSSNGGAGRRIRKTILTTGIAVWLLSGPQLAHSIAGCDGDGSCDYTEYYSATADAFGQSFSAWSAEWWQHALSIPTSMNPMLDTNGSRCMIGQRGPVWFLQGVFAGISSPIVTRKCDIPEGKALFFPVLNSIQFNSPNVCGSPSANQSVATLRAAAAKDLAKASTMSVQVDGLSVPALASDNLNFRVKSTVFETVLPEQNVFDPLCTPDNVPKKVYSPSVADGVYVMLKPLSLGLHTVRIQASNTDGFSVDVTYQLKVVHVRNN